MEELGRPNSWCLVNAITVNVEHGFFHETMENINRAIGSKRQAWSHGATQARLSSRSYLFENGKGCSWQSGDF